MSSTSDYLPFGRFKRHRQVHQLPFAEPFYRGSAGTCNVVQLLRLFGLILCGLLMPCIVHAQNPNSPTALLCGAPPVTDSYEFTEFASGEEPVGGPVDCEQARAIARSVNEVNGCCFHDFTHTLRKVAEQRARRACSEKAGQNFACDIYVTDDTMCTEGCGMTTTPISDPNGCTTDVTATNCSGTARAEPVAGGQCVIMCEAMAESKATGEFDVSCSACTGDVNCGGAAEAQIEKKKRIAALEAKKEQLEAELASLNPQTPNYAEIAGEVMRDLLSIVSELNTLYSFFDNMKKLFVGGKSPAECK